VQQPGFCLIRELANFLSAGGGHCGKLRCRFQWADIDDRPDGGYTAMRLTGNLLQKRLQRLLASGSVDRQSRIDAAVEKDRNAINFRQALQAATQPALFPRDPYERARVRWFDEYADGGMGPSLTGKIFFQRVINAKLMKNTPDERLVAGALAEIPIYFGYLESQLGGNDYLVAGRFTLADISVLSQLVNLNHAGVTIDVATYPALARWFARVTERPTVTALIDQDRAFLAKVAG